MARRSRIGVTRLTGTASLARCYTSASTSFGITRRPAVACTCPDVVGLATWIEFGCPVHHDRIAAMRGIAARLREAKR